MQSEWVYKEISYCAIPIDLITWQKMWSLARIVYKSEAGWERRLAKSQQYVYLCIVYHICLYHICLEQHFKILTRLNPILIFKLLSNKITNQKTHDADIKAQA